MPGGLLFVDDEPLVRETYELFASPLRPFYNVFTAASGDEGVKLLKSNRFDVVITDLTMPGMDGLQFLAHVVRHQPDTARLIISGYADRLKVARCLFVGHRYFDKPCDTRSLTELLVRLASFREVVSNDKVRRIIGGLGSLPGPPETYLKIEKVLESPESSVQDISEVVEQDVAVTAKLLQIVNSAHFGLRRKVISADDAIQLVGIEAVRGLVLGLQAFAGYQNNPSKKAPPADLWDHSLRTAFLARRIAKNEDFPFQSCQRAFLAGLLHDVGRIVIHGNAPEENAEVLDFARRFRISASEAERRRFGADHAQIGAYLLTLWGIDEEVVSIVQHHASPAAYKGNDSAALTAVHVAHHIDANDSQSYPLDSEALASLGAVGLEARVEEYATPA